MSAESPLTGAGIGWRPELSSLLDGLPALGFSEIIAEQVGSELPAGLRPLLARGTPVVAHGVSLGLAGADRPDPQRLRRLAEAAERLGSPLVSEHVAFVRATRPAGGPGLHADVLEAGHLVPGPRTRESLSVLVANVREAMDCLPVRLAMENPAGTLAWPEDDLDEPAFLTELVEQTGCLLLLDLANLYVSCRAHGGDPHALLERMPLSSLAYVHVAGGAEHDGVYLDSHGHDIPEPVYDLVAHLRELTGPAMPGVLIERDEAIDPDTTHREWQRVQALMQGASSSGSRVTA